MADDLLNLPFSIQLTLGSGYLAYLIAYSGLREHHTATDTIFRTLAFGLIAASILTVFSETHYATLASAFFVTILVGILWRRFGMDLARAVLRFLNVSWSDDIPSAWISLTTETSVPFSQITVDLADGRMLHCKDTRLFEGAPHGPCLFGPDGSVAIYVTSEKPPEDSWIEHEDVFDSHEGWRLTYLPASTIRRVDVRLLGKMPKRPKRPEPESTDEIKQMPKDHATNDRKSQ